MHTRKYGPGLASFMLAWFSEPFCKTSEIVCTFSILHGKSKTYRPSLMNGITLKNKNPKKQFFTLQHWNPCQIWQWKQFLLIEQTIQPTKQPSPQKSIVKPKNFLVYKRGVCYLSVLNTSMSSCSTYYHSVLAQKRTFVFIMPPLFGKKARAYIFALSTAVYWANARSETQRARALSQWYSQLEIFSTESSQLDFGWLSERKCTTFVYICPGIVNSYSLKNICYKQKWKVPMILVNDFWLQQEEIGSFVSVPALTCISISFEELLSELINRILNSANK